MNLDFPVLSEDHGTISQNFVFLISSNVTLASILLFRPRSEYMDHHTLILANHSLNMLPFTMTKRVHYNGNCKTGIKQWERKKETEMHKDK